MSTIRARITNTKSDLRIKYRVMRGEAFSGFYIAMPYSMLRYGSGGRSGDGMTIGSRAFPINHTLKTIDGSTMPDSWFIDLAEDEVPAYLARKAA